MFESYLKGALLLANLEEEFKKVKHLIKSSHRLVLCGCGGSNSAILHMSQDYLKMAGIKTLSPDSPSLLTCIFNDFSREDAFREWAKVQRESGDLLIVVSSSGESDVTINCAKYFKSMGNKVITLTGFNQNNRLSQIGDVNVWFDTREYGVAEIFSEAFLHAILDSILEDKKNGFYQEYAPTGTV